MLTCIWTVTNQLIQTWDHDRYYCAVYFNTSLIDLDLDSRSQECEKATTSVPIMSQSFQWILMEFGILLRFVSVMNQIFILFCLFNIQGRDYVIS